LTVEDGTAIATKINGGNWTVEQKHALAVGVSGALVAVESKKVAARCNQNAPTIEKYLTKLDVEFLENKSNTNVDLKLKHICARAWSLGITCPTEKLSARIASIVICLSEGGSVDAATAKSLLDMVKQNIKDLDKKKKHPFPHMETLPLDPETLAADRKIYSYGKDDGPLGASFTVAGVEGCLMSMAKRGTHKSLRGPMTVARSGQSSCSRSPANASEFAMAFQPIFENIMKMQERQRSLEDKVKDVHDRRHMLCDRADAACNSPTARSATFDSPTARCAKPLQHGVSAESVADESEVGSKTHASLSRLAIGSAINGVCDSANPVESLETKMKDAVAAAQAVKGKKPSKGKSTKTKAKGRPKAESKAKAKRMRLEEAEKEGKAVARKKPAAASASGPMWSTDSPGIDGCCKCRFCDWGCKKCREHQGIQVIGTLRSRKWRRLLD